jgi:hypothetical protein
VTIGAGMRKDLTSEQLREIGRWVGFTWACSGLSSAARKFSLWACGSGRETDRRIAAHPLLRTARRHRPVYRHTPILETALQAPERGKLHPNE